MGMTQQMGRCDDGRKRKSAAVELMSIQEAVGWMHKYRLRKECY